MKYVAPITGFYTVSGQVTKAVPTGRMVEKANPNCHWWTPWRPETILVKEYKFETEESVTQTVYLNQGEYVISKTGINRIGS